eukprot:2041269-Prymnesium_polylepis.1
MAIAPATGDQLAEEHRRMLQVPVAQRDDAIAETHVELTTKLCGDKSFLARLDPDLHRSLARCWRYQFFPRGVAVCMENEAVNYFFIVVEGTLTIEEARIHHAEKFMPRLNTATARFAPVGKGTAFGHLPIMLNSASYGYSATSGSSGCSLLLVKKSDYNAVLRRDIEREMNAVLAVF